jgi:hypothetical protein
MKDQLKLSIALLNAFDRARTVDERWHVIERAECIMVRRAKRAMIIRAENNSAKLEMVQQNAPIYEAMRRSAIRIQNNLSVPKVVLLAFN